MTRSRAWRTSLGSLLLALPLALPACAPADEASDGNEGAFTSATGTLLDFEFDGEVVASNMLDARRAVRAQLFFSVGQLNGENSVGRVEKADVEIVEQKDNVVRYHAKLPVSWGSKKNLPTSYELVMPRDVGNARAFEQRYRSTCTVPGDDRTHDYWFEYRPKAGACSFAAADVVRAQAKVTQSPLNVKASYPEYQRIWEDDRFEAIMIFGKNQAGNMGYDPGTSNFNSFLKAVKTELKGATVKTTPEQLADAPGPQTRDVTLEGTFPDGRTFKITVFLLDEMRSPWAGFEARYASLTANADYIAYNGHAGLGGNIQALARMGKWQADKYLVFYMNGCDTYAYVDDTLPKARGAGGADDPNGTKNLEFVTNAMPSFFSDNVDSTLGLFRGFMNIDSPKSYAEMLDGMPKAGMVVVNGDEDNVFKPGMAVRPKH